MYKKFTIDEYQVFYKENATGNGPYKRIQVILNGVFTKEHNEKVQSDSDFLGRLKQNKPECSIAIGASIKDLVPNAEMLYGKKVRIYGITTRSYIALYNLETITKVEVLGEDDTVIETYDSNETSKAKLREYFERMGYEIPEELKNSPKNDNGR